MLIAIAGCKKCKDCTTVTTYYQDGAVVNNMQGTSKYCGDDLKEVDGSTSTVVNGPLTGTTVTKCE